MIDKIALILAIIGGLNWGLVGIFQLDAVAWVRTSLRRFGKHFQPHCVYACRAWRDLVRLASVPSGTTGSGLIWDLQRGRHLPPAFRFFKQPLVRPL